jgi:pyruvate/2-oxoacid:ferredoxin oxidoreductase alpha subunit
MRTWNVFYLRSASKADWIGIVAAADIFEATRLACERFKLAEDQVRVMCRI